MKQQFATLCEHIAMRFISVVFHGVDLACLLIYASGSAVVLWNLLSALWNLYPCRISFSNRTVFTVSSILETLTDCFAVTMDAIDPEALRESLMTQGWFFRAQEQCLQEVTAQVVQLTAQLSQLTSQLSATALPHTAHTTPVTKPDKYAGDPTQCRGFILQSELYLSLLEDIPNKDKMVTIISLLTGKALTWATAVWEKKGKTVSTYGRFIAAFRQVFDHAPKGKAVSERLITLTQGHK